LGKLKHVVYACFGDKLTKTTCKKNHLKKLFKLEGYILDRVEYRNSKIFLYCHLQRKSMVFSGETSKRVTENRVRYLSHMILEDETVILVVSQRRFCFPKHRTRRWEPLPDVSSRRQTTNTFRLNTLRELQRDNYSGTGYRRKKSHMYAAHILDSMDMEIKWSEGITKIGLDGKGVRKNRLVHNITNLSDNRPLAVLPDMNQKQFKKN
jgi:hypothetical protein